MPPKKATASATATRETATKKRAAATKKATPAPEDPEPEQKKKAVTKKTAATTKKAPATKKAAPAATTAAPKKPVPVKKVTGAKKTSAKSQKASEESDKENVGTDAKAKATKRKRTAEQSEAEDEQDKEAEAETGDEVEKRATKRTKVSPAPAAPKKIAPVKAKKVPAVKKVAAKKVINEVPTEVMDIFVFGEGSSGELGLGSVKYEGKKPIDVKRPRINHNLSGIVQVACGGMHVAALTKENKIMTWGVNDQGALGRDTTWEGGLRDMDEDSDSEDDDDTGLNPHESTPAEVDVSEVPEGTKWVQIVASDSATFALTETGEVYGWGTFRSNEGILGFSRSTLIQNKPAHIPELSKVKQLAAGSNHILALDEKNKIYAWGAGQQAQLARRLLERDDASALYPSGVGSLPGRAKAEKLSCGSYHCFVLDTKSNVIGWGLNNYAELGIEAEVGTDGGFILKPQLVDSLKDKQVVEIAGGEHHSLACTADGELLTWGRIDGHQVGQPADTFTQENTVWDEKNQPRVLLEPSAVPGISDVVKVAAGTDHSFAITKDGKVYSWGFSANYQTGQGTTEDVKVPTLIDNSAIRDRKIIFAGAGGQYSILGAEAEE
ncbi:regulator of chromosome condensation 1/beta-lactamase-inhibitor protein II [Cercophora newfieldiana]|uniref:Regulator of chromosome condensation 1/beta-lactamase-inhibitor protein II n=1 Tax=Cercophora newfieldiana TaxID=92897 RepID=A0AA39Y114_9PEZI|nr:regulator of chromosome condensation 1/beta-lactamase-inhibitor protein II [Cercophora newfieldiana]